MAFVFFVKLLISNEVDPPSFVNRVCCHYQASRLGSQVDTSLPVLCRPVLVKLQGGTGAVVPEL